MQYAMYDPASESLLVLHDVGNPAHGVVQTDLVTRAHSLNDADDRLDQHDLRRVGCWAFHGRSEGYVATLEPVDQLVAAGV